MSGRVTLARMMVFLGNPIRDARLLVAIAVAMAPLSWPALAGEVAPAASEVDAIAVGELAPSVVLRDVDGNPVRLDAYVGEEPVALVFYRGGW